MTRLTMWCAVGIGVVIWAYALLMVFVHLTPTT